MKREKDLELMHQAEELQTRVGRLKVKSSPPSRSKVHQHKKKKSKAKIKIPWLRLLSLSFILLPFTFYGLYSYMQKQPVKTMSRSELEVVQVSNEAIAEEPIPTTASADHMEKQKASSEQEKQGPEEKVVAKVEEEKKNESEKAPPESNVKNKDDYTITYHTVKPGETIFRISMNYYKSQEGIPLIREWNGLSGNEISVGQSLKIPIKK